MKKTIIIPIILNTILSCGSVNRTMFGTTEKNLLKTVSIEQGCETENIVILEKLKGLHGATYALNVCGSRMVYKQVGSVFMEASKADQTIKSLKEN